MKNNKHKCLICKKLTSNNIYCSLKCKGVGFTGKGNPRYGKVGWNKGLTKKTDSRVAKQARCGIKNGNHKVNGGKWNGERWENYSKDNKKRIEICNKISESSKGKKYDYYNRAIRSKYGLEGFKDSNYRRHLNGLNFVKCKVCNKKIKVGGIDGIYVHHIDENRDNNKIDNLKFVCPKCHNLKEHDTTKNLEKGWKITHKKGYKQVRKNDNNIVC